MASRNMDGNKIPLLMHKKIWWFFDYFVCLCRLLVNKSSIVNALIRGLTQKPNN